ncbi:ankyrin repeat domain-containing protein 39-like [Centruroides vittatus]|uniref:ankyrin repeat domain-containing protein 39-like n=1 Tax=Centruroides vittatus TaxID=120091 RepID=UPI003510B39E
MNSNQSHQHTNHCCHSAYSSVHQTLEELDFEKGIWSAALYGDYDRVKEFIDKNKDPSVRDSSGYTALHYAARNNQLQVCKLLLKSGANPNAQTPGGATPLHRAAFKGNYEIVQLLLQSDGDPTICDCDGKTPIDKAVENNHKNVENILKEAAQNKIL